MSATYDDVCRLALAFPGVIEGHAYGGSSLHVGRKFLGRLREDGETLVLKVDQAERENLLEEMPDAFFLTDHYQPHPLVLVNLLAVKMPVLERLIEEAWRALAPKRVLSGYEKSKP
ncbi:MAG: MmcQ/YjbR family DNA-binding protein [Chthoniobacterales bacterium]|nr:MmcQ/YjbR family DNA-binding protein [Chthoniobacterales bacterium]